MAIDPIGSGDGAAVIRTKTNSAISKANEVDSKASLTSLEAAKLLLRAGINRSATARPGDNPEAFTSSISGRAEALAPLTIGTSVVGADGMVRRIVGVGIIARRQNDAIEPGLLYSCRWTARRTVTPADPVGHAIQCAIRWLDANMATISTLIVYEGVITVASGLHITQATFSIDQAADYVIPANARYARAMTRTYGEDGSVDIASIDFWASEGAAGPEGPTGPAAEPIDQGSWAGLAAITGSYAGQPARSFADAGEHTDPVTGLTVSDRGQFAWNFDPIGWARIGDIENVDVPSSIAGAAPVTSLVDTDQVAVRRTSDGLLRSISYSSLVALLGAQLGGAAALSALTQSVARKADLYAVNDLRPLIRPVILGQVVLAQALTIDLGLWPVSVAYVWQWMQNGVPIAGATGPTYVVASGDVGKTITAVISVTEVAGTRRVTATARVMAPMPATVVNLVGFGDSIMRGQGATVDAKQFIDLVAAALSAGVPNNQGSSGTVLQNSPDSSGSPRASNGRDRYTTAVMGANAAELVISAYGFNDARYVANPDRFNVSAYINDYREVLGGILAEGYPRNRIVVVTPHYMIDDGLATAGTAGFYGQSRAGFEAYVAASKQVADEFGVYWADSYTPMKAAVLAGQTIIGADKIHPNDAGHQIIATAVLAATKRPDPDVAATVVDFLDGADGAALVSRMPDVGLGWERQTGYAPTLDAQFANGRLFGPATNAVYRNLTAPASADYSVEIEMVCLDTSAADVGVIGRASPRLNTFYWAHYSRAGAAFELSKTVAGVTTLLGSSSADAFLAGTVRKLSLTMIGSAISVQVDGATRIAVTDTEVTKPGFGGVRFGVAGSSTGGVHLSGFTLGTFSALLLDTFTAANGALLLAHLPDIGLGYALQSGFTAAVSPVVLNNRVRSQTSSSVYRNLTPPPGSDYAVEGVFDFVGALTDDCGVIGRASGTEQTLYFARYRHGSGWDLYKAVAGAQTLLANSPDDWSAGSRTVRLTMKGTAISVQVNGVTVIAVTDAAIASAGFAGIRFGTGQTAITGRHCTSLRVIKA